MKELMNVTAVTVNGAIVKVEDAVLIAESNGIYEVLVTDGTYNAVAAPKMGPTVVTLTGNVTKVADTDIAPVTKDLKVHADDLPKSEAKAFIAKLGHSKLTEALMSEKELMDVLAHKILNDEEVMTGAIDAALKAMGEDSGETRESIREKIEEEAEAQLAVEVDPFTAAFTAAFRK